LFIYQSRQGLQPLAQLQSPLKWAEKGSQMDNQFFNENAFFSHLDTKGIVK
jgi:hypothetical protein